MVISTVLYSFIVETKMISKFFVSEVQNPGASLLLPLFRTSILHMSMMHISYSTYFQNNLLISPTFAKLIHFPLLSLILSIFRLNLCFLLSAILTIMHVCIIIMLYTYWTTLPLLRTYSASVSMGLASINCGRRTVRVPTQHCFHGSSQELVLVVWRVAVCTIAGSRRNSDLAEKCLWSRGKQTTNCRDKLRGSPFDYL